MGREFGAGVRGGKVAVRPAGPVPRAYLLLLLPLLLLAAGFAGHEAWRDEIQAWLMGREFGILELLANAGNEGHPIGWHLLCKFFFLAHLPFETLQVFSLSCAVGAGALLVSRGPFPVPALLLILCSPIFQLLGIAARPYMLIVFLLFAQAALFPSRMRAPLRYALCLGALSQLMVLCLPYVGFMALWWSWEAAREKAGKRVLFALALAWLLLFFAAFQLFPPLDKMRLMLEARGAGLMAWGVGGGFSALPAHVLAVLAAGVCLGLVWLRAFFRCHPLLAAAAAASVLFAAFVDVLVYPLSTSHWYAVTAMLVAASWTACAGGRETAPRERKLLCALACIACLGIMPAGIAEWKDELLLPSSNLPPAEAFFRTELAGEDVAAHTMARISPLLKNTPGGRLWDPAGRRWRHAAVFDADWYRRRSLSVGEAARSILDACPARRPVMVFSAPWEDAAAFEYKLVIEFSRPTVYDESFFFYRSQEPFPDCGPDCGP